MTKDPNQLFVMNAISRQGIAEMIRDVIHCCKFQAMNGEPQELANDDPRLTDEICQAYADALSQDDDPSNSEEWVEELEHNAAVQALEDMGYRQLEEEFDEIQERHMLVKTIADLVFDLTMKRAQLMQLDEKSAVEHVQVTEPPFLD